MTAEPAGPDGPDAEDQRSRLRRRAQVIRQLEEARTLRSQIAPRRTRIARMGRAMRRF